MALTPSVRPRTSPLRSRARAALMAALLCGTVAAAAPAMAEPDDQGDTPPATYTVTFTLAETPGAPGTAGEEGADGLTDVMSAASSLEALRDDPPPSLLGLARRIDKDREQLAAVLRSEGYFDGTVEITAAVGDGDAPTALTVTAHPGPRYHISRVALGAADGGPPPGGPVALTALKLAPGDPARGPLIRDAEGRLPLILAQRGYPAAKVGDRRLVIDRDTHTMDVQFIVTPGPLTRFGPTRFTGLRDLDEAAAQARLPWHEGDIYDPAKVDKARDRLTDLGVFSQVRVALAGPDSPSPPPPAITNPDGSVTQPLDAVVAERDRHYITVGLTYGTQDGLATNATWGDRNLMGSGDPLTITGSIGGIGRKKFRPSDPLDYGLGSTLKKPDILDTDSTLTLSAQLLSEHPEAYTRDALQVGATLQYPLTSNLVGTIGATFEQASITQDETGNGITLTRTDADTLVGIPVGLTLDASNDLLDPTRGVRLSGTLTPYFSPLGDSGSFFVIGKAQASGYLPLDDNASYVLAGRVAIGGIHGGDRAAVPADKRFYGGGGGSIRGYGYQQVGPFDAAGKPSGGLSMVETGAELRVRLTDTLGIAPFLDGGNVYTSDFPTFDQHLRWGTGLGVRYYTPFGPLRLDIGVPLDRHDNDSAWQLYISIGQSF